MTVHTHTDLYPSKKVLFADARDVWNYVRTPLNPQELSIDLRAVYGELDPIGWSTSLQQYGHTGSPEFSIDLTYTMQTAERIGMSKQEFEKGYAFYLSFCYPRRRGEDPSELYMVVPNTFAVLCRVHGCRVTFRKWTVAMQLREYSVSLQLKLVGESFRDAANVRRIGYSAVDRKLASNDVVQLGRLANTPLKMAASSAGSRPSGK